MAINLASEYSTLLDKRFTQKSLTDAWCGHDYNWNGVNSINVWTIGQADLGTYTASGAYRFTNGNAPTEVQDEINTYVLSNNLSFAHTMDITNVQDQKNIKKANAFLKQVWDEQIVPKIDADRLEKWIGGAGTVTVGSALTKSTVIEAILTGGSVMNNNLVNRDGRVCFVTESLAVKCKLASELQYNEKFTEKAIVNGEIARLNGMPIVAVPDSWFPSGVEFMIKYKRASADPMKLKMLRALTTVPGLAGSLVEGLVRYDSFVLAQKAMGICVYATTGNACTLPTIAVSSGVATFTLTTANSDVVYTLDGTNPKTSSTAETYNPNAKPGSVTSLPAGTIIRFYDKKTGLLDSGLGSHVVTNSEA